MLLKREINPNELRENLTKSLVAFLLMTSIYKLLACKKYISAFAVSFFFICGIINEYDAHKQEQEILQELSEEEVDGFI